jgi:hypothetical protein
MNGLATSLKSGLFYGVLCSMALAQALPAAIPSPSYLADEIATAQTENQPRSSYRVVRKYRVFPSDNPNAASEIVAAIDFLLPTAKSYTIQRASGNRRAEQVVRGILDHEVAASAQGRQIPTAAMMRDNYDVSF